MAVAKSPSLLNFCDFYFWLLLSFDGCWRWNSTENETFNEIITGVTEAIVSIFGSDDDDDDNDLYLGDGNKQCHRD